MALKTKIVAITMLGVCGIAIACGIGFWNIEQSRVDYTEMKNIERASVIIYDLERIILKKDAVLPRIVESAQYTDTESKTIELIKATDDGVAPKIADLRKLSSGDTGQMQPVVSALSTFESKWNEYTRDTFESAKDRSILSPEEKEELRNNVDEAIAHLHASVKELQSELNDTILRSFMNNIWFLIIFGLMALVSITIISFFIEMTISMGLRVVVANLSECLNAIISIVNGGVMDDHESESESAANKAILNTQANVLMAMIEELIYIISGKRRKTNAGGSDERVVIASRREGLLASDVIPLGEDDDF